MTLAILSSDDQPRTVRISALRPSPGLKVSVKGPSVAASIVAQTGGTIQPPLGLHEPLKLCAAWQGWGLACETDCSTTDVSASEPPSPTISSGTGQPGRAASTDAAAAVAPGDYVPGRTLQQSIAKGQQTAIPLCLEEVLEQTTTSNDCCPSVGSVGHWMGLCKPCDFLHRIGCTKGASCEFCHLCGPDEGKRRKAQKRAMIKVARERRAGGPVSSGPHE